MDIHINNDETIQVNYLTLQKMAFLFNALENGWQIRKSKEKYIFTKKHEGKKEVFLDSYLKRFVEENFNINKIISE
jgi:hypothetical protein